MSSCSLVAASAPLTTNSLTRTRYRRASPRHSPASAGVEFASLSSSSLLLLSDWFHCCLGSCGRDYCLFVVGGGLSRLLSRQCAIRVEAAAGRGGGWADSRVMNSWSQHVV